MWVQFAHAGHCFAGGGWEDVVGGFECGPRFDDTADGACESMGIVSSLYLGILLMMLASAILYSTQLPPSSTLHPDPFLISCVP